MTSRIIHWFAITLVIALVGGAFLIVRTAAQLISGLPVLAALVAIAVVALAFLPLKESFERLVNRFMPASRPTAYHVLADLTRLSRATSADASNLTGVAEAIAARLGARTCQLTVISAGLRDRNFTWSAGGPATSDDDVVLPIRQGVEQVGRIAVNRAAAAGTRRRQLLEDIADSLGAIVAVSRLGMERERQLRAGLAHVEDIAASRRQAVTEMDSERRTIGRNLHDGAQHHLVSLRMVLDLVEHEVACGQFDQARDRLGQLATQISSAEAVLAETATGVSSIMLTKHGLIAALNADLSSTHPPITVTSPEAFSGRRFSAEIEAAVYFCCREAVNNARTHAPGATVSVRLDELDGALRFTIRDDGPGFASEPGSGDTGDLPRGRGMRNVRARITAVGGTVSIRSAPGAGTTVEGAVPLPRLELTEIDLLEELRSGRLPMTADERLVAEQLLGAAGSEPRTRLGLGRDAGTAEVRQIAEQQRERWQHRASHPASTRAVRHAAEVLVLTCEQLLTLISTE